MPIAPGTILVFSTFTLLVCTCLVSSIRADTPPLISDDASGIIAAFGDFDSDKLTDVFVIRSVGRSFSILRGFKDEPVLRPPDDVKKWTCDLKRKDGEVIVSLMPADFHGMAMMDVLVVTRKDSHLFVYIVQGDKRSLNCTNLEEGHSLAKLKSEPLIFDYNGDMIADILGQDADDSKRYVWTSKMNRTFENRTIFGSEVISDPNSNAFVDLNNDTIPDVFISGSEWMEFWYMAVGGFAKTPKKVNYPSDSSYKVKGLSTFFDVNSDGIIDHIMPVCLDKKCDNSAIVALLSGYEWVVIASQFVDTSNSSHGLTFLLNTQQTNGITFPLKLRHADVDGDGYPDVIAIMRPVGGGAEKVVILKNVATGVHNANNMNRTFIPTWTINVPDGQRPVLASFFDLFEDGKADVLVSSMDSSNKLKINAIANTAMFDACFLKVMVASGLCFEDCSKGREPSLEPSSNTPVAYGTNQPGPNICYELVDTEGYKQLACQGQLTQSANFALQMPYAIFGLGSTPNFVDTLTATIPSPGTENKRQASWTQIVPDAQVVLIPNPPDQPHAWRSKLFLTPSDIVLSTLITLASICVLLILIIAALHRREILEDIAEHEEYKRHWPDSR